jgi:hypothetical protein
VDCDYYDWKKGKPWAINAYRGEYMSQYSWAELTHGTLENPVIQTQQESKNPENPGN